MMRETNVDQFHIRFAGQPGHPKKVIVRGARACNCCHFPTAIAWLHANVMPRRPRTTPCRHQALWGAAKDGSCQTKAWGERLSRYSEARLGLGGVTLNACSKGVRNRRCVEACGRRNPPSVRKAQHRTDGRQRAALLGVWLTGRFAIPFAAACGRARWYSDRSRR
jgi:hypothetical protein